MKQHEITKWKSYTVILELCGSFFKEMTFFQEKILTSYWFFYIRAKF